MLCTMIGSEYCGITEEVERDVFGQFNIFLKNKILVVLNEMSGSAGFKYNNKLKHLITAKADNINNKHIKLRDVRSFTHFILQTMISQSR